MKHCFEHVQEFGEQLVEYVVKELLVANYPSEVDMSDEDWVDLDALDDLTITKIAGIKLLISYAASSSQLGDESISKKLHAIYGVYLMVQQIG